MSVRPDLQLDSAAAQSIVDRVVSGHTVATLADIHGGEIAAVYEITFVNGTHPPLVVKVYPDALHWKMQKEVTVVGLIQGRLSVPVPRVLYADDSRKLLALNFIVMNKLDGSILGVLERTLDSEQLANVHLQIGQLLREFHQIGMAAFGYIGPNGIWTAYATNHAYLTFQFRRKLEQFTERGGSEHLARRITRYVSERDELLHACKRAVLCHNDLHAGNLLAAITERTVRLSGVLDFEGALAGDPLMDVAKTLYYVGDELKGAVLQGYGDMEREHWSETLDLYRLYFVLELWCWMAEIGNKQPLDKLASDLARYSTA